MKTLMKTIWMIMPMMVCGLVGGVVAAGAYEPDPAISGVTVSGRILFSGSVPKPNLVPVHRDSKFCGEMVSIEALQVDGSSHGVTGVVVSLEGIERGKPAVPEQIVIVFENHTCRFVPRVNAAMIGSQMEIRNVDPILHNTHIRQGDRFGPTVINVAQPPGANVIRKPVRVAGFLDIRCDAHTFMTASMQVFEHPYFAVTDRTGRFEFTQVPPGNYKLRLWHERLGTRMKSITVHSTGPLALDVEMGSEE